MKNEIKTIQQICIEKYSHLDKCYNGKTKTINERPLKLEPVKEIRIYQTLSGDNFLNHLTTFGHSDFKQLTETELIEKIKNKILNIPGYSQKTVHLQFDCYPSGWLTCDGWANLHIEKLLKTINNQN